MQRFTLVAAFGLLLATLQVLGQAVELTEANFEASLAGKSSLVMFKAPWCGHCKKMTPDFDQVASEVNSDSTQLAFVDCTVHKDLCTKHGVTGYPTLKVFDAETGTDEGKAYSGGRDQQSLRDYAAEHLKPSCTPDNVESCSDKEKDYIKKMKDSASADLQAALDRLEKMKSNPMAKELKQWVMQRLSILKALLKNQ